MCDILLPIRPMAASQSDSRREMFKLLLLGCFVSICLGVKLERLRPLFTGGRIVGGTNVTIEQAPYQLALEVKGFQFCGAAIISDRYAISAAHCVDGLKAEYLSVRTGTSLKGHGGTVIQVARVIPSPDYDPYNVDYDVAIIELTTTIPLGPASRPLVVADEEPVTGEEVTVTGWGAIKEAGPTPLHLQSAAVSISDRVTCNEAYRKQGGVTSRMICAGVPGRDSCQGDSGGPLVRGGSRIVGVVSWGYGCARKGYPGVYTNLANPEIRTFIRNVTGV